MGQLLSIWHAILLILGSIPGKHSRFYTVTNATFHTDEKPTVAANNLDVDAE